MMKFSQEKRKAICGLIAVLVTIAAFLPGSAWAVCTDANFATDFQQADLVVRVRAVAETEVSDDEPSPAFIKRWGEYSPVALYRLRVIESFKGKPGPTISYFQTIDSGRFDLEIGKEYLLFLHYWHPYRGSGSIVRGATYVEHTCGQSKLWSEMDQGNFADLHRLRM